MSIDAFILEYRNLTGERLSFLFCCVINKKIVKMHSFIIKIQLGDYYTNLSKFI